MSPASSRIEPEESETLSEVLERIRASASADVSVSCVLHQALHRSPQARRLLAAAAHVIGKNVVFSQAPGAPRARPGPPAEASEIAREREPRAPTFRQWHWTQAAGILSIRRERAYPALLTACAGAVLTGVLVLVLPRARVTVTLASEPLATDLTFFLDTSATEPRLSDKTYPARSVVVEETVEEEHPVTTTVERGDRASGTVELVNETTSPQGIRAASRLESASGVIVRTERGVIVPSRGRAGVAVRADVGGTRGNLEPQRLRLPALPETAQRVLSAEVVTSLHGGTDRPTAVVAQADVDRALGETESLVKDALRSRLEAERRSGESSAPASILERSELSRVTVEPRALSVPVGTESERFRLRAAARAEALIAGEDGLRMFLQSLLRARVGEGREPQGPTDLTDLRVLAVRWEERRAELSLHIETTVIPALSPQLLRAQIAGEPADAAERLLRMLPGVRGAAVALSPWWIRRVPRNPRNVHLTVETAGDR